MKRSLHQLNRFSNSKDSYNVQLPHKKMKPSTSTGDIAALTLLSLALTSSKARIDVQKPRLPSLHLSSSQRRSSSPVLIRCDKVETLVSEETAMSKPSKVIQHCALPKTLTEPESNILLSDDWRKVFKPLPMPPKLPKLPAGAKARSFVVKKADLTQ